MPLPRPQLDDPVAIRQALAAAFDMIEHFEAWHEIGATGQPAFANSWVNFGSPHAVAAFYKDVTGRVHLKGLVKSGTAATIFTLPNGYRPPETLIFMTVEGTNGAGRLDINTDGTVQSITGNNAYRGLNVSFRAVPA